MTSHTPPVRRDPPARSALLSDFDVSVSQLKDVAFIDLEASGLSARSWPIEVGWCFADGAARAMFIRPDEAWSLDDWDKNAEALHGIAYKTLLKDGVAAGEVCNKLNEALAGKLVFSDAPDWDGFWLYRLFQAAKTRQRFVVGDFSSIFRSAPPEKVEACISEADRKAPRTHRAIPDVLHMRTLYELAGQL